MAFMNTYDLEENKRIRMSLKIGVIYAASDEIHQLFIPGRTARITDVMIDSMGVLLGILCVLFVIKLLKVVSKNRHNI